MKLSDVGITEKGGTGSGNFGHAGRPGEVGGSIPGGASIGLSSMAQAAIVDREGRDKWRPMGHEILTVVGTDGKPVHVIGDEHAVTFTPEAVRAATNGELMIHSHMMQDSFSPTDLEAQAELGTKVSIVNAWDKNYPATGYRYTMTGGNKERYSAMAQEGKAMIKAAQEDVTSMGRAGLPAEHPSVRLLKGGMHGIWEKLATKYGVTYIREKLVATYTDDEKAMARALGWKG